MPGDGPRTRLLRNFENAGLFGNILVGSVVCALAAFVLLAFRIHPAITASVSTGLVGLSGFCLYRLFRRKRAAESRWNVALDVAPLLGVALAGIAIAFFSHCSCV
jgi:hypothetical protein